MNKQYQQLTQQPRYQIYAYRKAGMSLRQIANELNVHFSTISRELSRNAVNSEYDPEVASIARKQTSIKANRRSISTNEVIRKCLQLNWSPLAISQRIAVELEAADMLSHTTIYRRIEEDRRQGGALYRQLPRYGKSIRPPNSVFFKIVYTT